MISCPYKIIHNKNILIRNYGNDQYMCFWLNYSEQHYHLGRILVDLENIEQHFCMVNLMR